MKKNNILITGGLSKLGVEFIKLNIKKNIFYILYNDKTKIQKLSYLKKKKNIIFLKVNFKNKNVSKIKSLLRKIHKIDILIFMSSYNPGQKKIYNYSLANLIDSFYVNYLYHFLILQIIYKKMSKLNQGQIINISSNSALTGGNMIYPYASMKAAMSNIIKALKTDQKFIKSNIKIKNYFFKTITNFKIAAKKIKF